MKSPSTRVLIDANVLFSAFIGGREVYSLLFSQLAVYVPDFAFVELEKYKRRILKKTKLSEKEFQEFVLRLLKDVGVVPNMLLSESSLSAAFELCREIDEKDTPYVATAIEFDMTLVTNDKKLHTHLNSRGFKRTMLLADAIEALFQDK